MSTARLSGRGWHPGVGVNPQISHTTTARDKGILVTRVFPDSPASRADRARDMIVAGGEKEAERMEELSKEVRVKK